MAEKNRHSKKRGGLKPLRLIIIIAIEAALAFSIVKLIKYKKESDESAKTNEELSQAVTFLSPPPTYPETVSDEDYSMGTPTDDGSDAVSLLPDTTETAAAEDPYSFPIEVDFSLLLSKNPDCVAWLYSRDTPINLAVLQADDNTYYLYRTFDRVENGYGTIFLECNCSPGFTDANCIIFGHDMLNGTMFGTLEKYKDQSYYEAHPYLWLATEYRNYRLDVVAGLVHDDSCSIYSTPIARSSTDDFVPFAIKNSVFTSGAQYDPEANYVTLSTCCTDFAGARLAIVCEMVEMK